jgi:DnaJ-class molecular chaperone
MTRPANPPEERVLQSLRQTNVISKAEFDAAVALLEETVPCDKCGGDGNAAPEGEPPTCNKCDSTGQMFVIR